MEDGGVLSGERELWGKKVGRAEPTCICKLGTYLTYICNSDPIHNPLNQGEYHLAMPQPRHLVTSNFIPSSISPLFGQQTNADKRLRSLFSSRVVMLT